MMPETEWLGDFESMRLGLDQPSSALPFALLHSRRGTQHVHGERPLICRLLKTYSQAPRAVADFGSGTYVVHPKARGIMQSPEALRMWLLHCCFTAGACNPVWGDSFSQWDNSMAAFLGGRV